MGREEGKKTSIEWLSEWLRGLHERSSIVPATATKNSLSNHFLISSLSARHNSLINYIQDLFLSRHSLSFFRENQTKFPFRDVHDDDEDPFRFTEI